MLTDVTEARLRAGSAEFAGAPIRVTTIEPGYIDTALSAAAAQTPRMVDVGVGVAAWWLRLSASVVGLRCRAGRGNPSGC